MISSKYTIREQNEANILNNIIKEKEISRAELSVKTGLNKASVSSITKRLMEDQLILETRIGDSTNVGGRKPIMLTFNAKSALAIAIDLGNDYIEGMLAYLDGTIVQSLKKRKISVTATSALSHIKEMVAELLASEPETPHGIIGMTVAIHGIVFESEILFAPYYDLEQINLLEEMEKVFDFPVAIRNEANLAALGEYTYASDHQSLVSISIYSGVGAGIVEDGKLHEGKCGNAGEIGHSILFPDGKSCPCGNKGCLEQYTSSTIIYDEFSKLKNIEHVNSDIITECLTKNDKETKELLMKNAKLLSNGINNVITMYDPEIVIVNSSLYRKNPEMITWLKDNLNSSFSKNVEILTSTLQKSARLYGAVANTTQQFLNIQALKFK